MTRTCILLALTGACVVGRPGPRLSARVAAGPECEFAVEGGTRVVGTGRLHTLGNNGAQGGRLGLSCGTREGGYRSVLIVFNVAAGRGTIPDGTYAIVRGRDGVSLGEAAVAEVLYDVPPLYLAANGGTVTVRRDAEGRVIARVDATTVRRRRPW